MSTCCRCIKFDSVESEKDWTGGSFWDARTDLARSLCAENSNNPSDDEDEDEDEDGDDEDDDVGYLVIKVIQSIQTWYLSLVALAALV